jgi:hypothetical protein
MLGGGLRLPFTRDIGEIETFRTRESRKGLGCGKRIVMCYLHILTLTVPVVLFFDDKWTGLLFGDLGLTDSLRPDTTMAALELIKECRRIFGVISVHNDLCFCGVEVVALRKREVSPGENRESSDLGGS